MPKIMVYIYSHLTFLIYDPPKLNLKFVRSCHGFDHEMLDLVASFLVRALHALDIFLLLYYII
jgi:hypothetical protein